MKTVEFLDLVKKRHALHSDYAVSKYFGWRISRVYEYRGGHRELDDEACVQVATALDLPPPYVMACIAAARAKSVDIKKYWSAAARLLKTGTAAAILTTTLALSHIAPAPAASGQNAELTPYTLCAQRRRRLAFARPKARPYRRRRKTRIETPIVASST